MAWRKQNLTILNGGTRSLVLNLSESGARRAKDLTFYSPATLPETVTIYAAPDLVTDPADASLVPLQSGGTNFTLPAGRATQITGITSGCIVLVAGGAVAADRVFSVRGASRA